MRSLHGFIELDAAAAASGHVSYRAPVCDPWPCDLADPASPILRFAFAVNNDAPSALAIDMLDGTGYGFAMPSFDADSDVGAGSISNLRLFVNTVNSTLRINADVIAWLSSDAANCYFGCAGAQGQFVADVPERAGAGAAGLPCRAGRTAGRHRRGPPKRPRNTSTYPQLSCCVKPFCALY